ncbi:hypothetical protein [Iningainema tapete]
MSSELVYESSYTFKRLGSRCYLFLLQRINYANWDDQSLDVEYTTRITTSLLWSKLTKRFEKYLFGLSHQLEGRMVKFLLGRNKDIDFNFAVNKSDISTDLEFFNLVIEYHRLLSLPELSNDDIDRVAKILELAQIHDQLSCWLSRVDVCVAAELGLLEPNLKIDSDCFLKFKEVVEVK